MEVTIEELKAVLSKTSKSINVDELEKDIHLTEQGIDSLDMMDYYLNLEEHYGIQIPDEDAQRLKTLNDFKSYLTEKLK